MNVTTKSILKTYWQFAWSYPRYICGLFVMIPVANIALRLVPPLIVASVVTRLSSGDFAKDNIWASFGREIVVYAVISFIGGVIAWRVVIYLIWKLESNVQSDLYRAMFAKYMKLGADFHANSFGGSLVSQTSKMVGAYIRLQDTFAFQVYTLFIGFVFISVVLYSRTPAFVWLMWGFSVIFITFAVMLSKPVRKLTVIEASAQNKVTGYLADAITNVMAVKSFASSKRENQQFDVQTDNMRHRILDVMWATTKRDIASSTITTTLSISAFVAAIYVVVANNAEIGTVFLLLAYTADITERLWELSSTTLRQYNRAIGDAHDGMQTLNTPSSVLNPLRPEKLAIDKGLIEFKDVTFDHEDDTVDGERLFQRLNILIKPKEKIGLVGASGGGKTTITKLLLRYMDIDGGVIAIDGQNIANITQDDLRSAIGYVPQEPLLFHRSLMENIQYGNPEANKESVIRAAKSAHAHEFIEKLPNGYGTLVGERGVKLSGGQKQRVVIARAILKAAPVLVLDEATSALDSESEVLIQEALWRLMKDRTAIVIAHRLSTIQKMDRIIVLDNGEIVEQGSHKELIRQDGTYAKLWAHQSGGFIED